MKASEVAKYYLSKNRKLFNNERLNNYLYLTQIVYLARYDKLLISDKFKFINNKIEVIDINLIEVKEKIKENKFLDAMYMCLENASNKEIEGIVSEIKVDVEFKDVDKNRYKGLIEALRI